MSKIKIVIIVLLLIISHMIAYQLGTNQSIIRALEASFDHSQCQYPERLSNPPNGCDNTDPARPECMKYGTEDCDIPLPEQQPVIEVVHQEKTCE